jgi:hypothetical protein
MGKERVPEQRKVEEGKIVMLFYLPCDVSWWMTYDTRRRAEA